MSRAPALVAALSCALLASSCTLDATGSALARDPMLAAAMTAAPGAPSPGETRVAVPVAPRDVATRRRADRERALSPLADSIARTLVFLGRGTDWFTASGRGRRLLIDLGRVDTKVTEPERRAAYVEAVERLAPVRKGDRFRIHGPWGSDDAVVRGYDVWSGRIVATLDVSRRVDSIVRRTEPLIASAIRSDSARPPVADPCRRDTLLSEDLLSRITAVRDSLEQELRPDSAKLYERLQSKIRVRSSAVTGCFADARVLLLVTLLAGDYEYVRERAVLVSDSGRVVALRPSDHRFRAHEALHAFDADGDGVDDIAARGLTTRAGSVVVMRLNRVEARLERMTAGFAWEAF